MECGEGGVAQLFFHISLQLRAPSAALSEESTTTLPIGAGIQSANQYETRAERAHTERNTPNYECRVEKNPLNSISQKICFHLNCTENGSYRMSSGEILKYINSIS